jgi:ComF family protein
VRSPGRLRTSLSSVATATARIVVEPVLTIVFPSTCVACGRPLVQPTAGPLCGPCWEGLPRHRAPTCTCGWPLPPGRSSCSRCRRGHQPLDSGASLGPYEGALRTVIHELKYRGRRRVATRLANTLLEEPSARAVVEGCDLLVPVPLHPRRLRERGFNQAALIARELGRRTRRPCGEGVLVRRKDTSPQTGLSAAERRRNVAGAFAVRRRGQVAGHAVTLVDDVLTTGATARACARALRESGAQEVRLLSVARVV